MKPILGKEVEDMELQNFQLFDDYVEEWGAKTTGEGTASFKFEEPNGTYNIRITYFDEEQGHSSVKLFVKDTEVIDFKLDQDVDCWDWRLFKNIKINQGDPIKLVVKSDQSETVRLDFVEFIPTEN